MKQLIREFEDQLRADSAGGKWIRVAVPRSNGKVMGGEVFPLASVLKLVPTAYASEGNRWLNTVWLPPKIALLDKILKIDDNKERFNDLLEIISREQVVPFVGAGMSLLSGIPSWGELLNKLRSSSSCNKAKFNRLLESYKYEEAADFLHASMHSDLFDTQLKHICQIENSRIKGAVRYLPALFTRLLLTTNFDQILEDVYTGDGLEMGRVLAGADIESFRKARNLNRPELIKLHGDYRNAASRIFTSSEYEAAYQPDSRLSLEFKNVVFNYSLLFLGASLSTDRTILLLQELAAYNVGGPIHYAFLRQLPTKPLRNARQDELMKSRILPIWFPVPANATPADYDLQIEALLAGLLYHSGKLKFNE
jgi:hypothetical protein